MSRDHPVDSYGPLLPAARPERHSLWLVHPPAEHARQAAPHMTQAMLPETSITVQARHIIETVLADTDPSLVDVQRSLRKSVAVHPGSPSKALLAHLLETRQRSNSGS
jgi:hypothetical protein